MRARERRAASSPPCARGQAHLEQQGVAADPLRLGLARKVHQAEGRQPGVALRQAEGGLPSCAAGGWARLRRWWPQALSLGQETGVWPWLRAGLVVQLAPPVEQLQQLGLPEVK